MTPLVCFSITLYHKFNFDCISIYNVTIVL